MRSFLVAVTGLTLLRHAAQPRPRSPSPSTRTAQADDRRGRRRRALSLAGLDRHSLLRDAERLVPHLPDGRGPLFKEFDDAPMPHSIFFTKIGHAIHGTDSAGRLGTPPPMAACGLSRANAATLYALVQEQGVLNTTVTLTGSSQVALARNPRRANTAVARRATDAADRAAAI